MILHVRVSPKASRNLIKKENNGLKVYLTRTPENGLANKQLVGLLAEYFNVKKYQIEIIKGDNSRNKIVKIYDA